MLGELGLEAGAGRARLDARRARDGIDLEHAVERAQVDRDDAGVARAPGCASTPPTTLVPPPNGTTATSCSPHQSSTERSSSSEAGKATPSGGCGNSPRIPRTTSR